MLCGHRPYALPEKIVKVIKWEIKMGSSCSQNERGLGAFKISTANPIGKRETFRKH